MKPEEILIEAEKLGVRHKVLARVAMLREKSPYIDSSTAYDLIWDEIQKEERV